MAAADPGPAIIPVIVTSATADEVCYEVVRAVAGARGVDPADVDERLVDAVDPDGLESLVRLGASGDVGGGVEFEYAGCRVHVTCDGEIEARPLSQEGRRSSSRV